MGGYYNPYTRVRLEAVLNRPDCPFGDWDTVNISTFVPPSARGTPLDWWVRGSVAGNISNAFRKGGSPNLFTVSVLGSDAGHTGTPPSWAKGTIQWSDGPTGNVSGSTTQAHQLDGPSNSGDGYRIQVGTPNVPLWPDYYLLKVWSWDYPSRRNRYAASLNNTPRNDSDAINLSYYEPNSGAGAGDDYTPWWNSRNITTEVLFTGDATGLSLVYDITRFYQYWMSIYAVALYRAAIPQSTVGAKKGVPATQRGRPAGA